MENVSASTPSSVPKGKQNVQKTSNLEIEYDQFVDDTALLSAEECSYDVVSAFQFSLNLTGQQSQKWRLSANPAKTKIMVLRQNCLPFPFTIKLYS